MSDFRKGGVNPNNYEKILTAVKNYQIEDLLAFDLKDTSTEDFNVIFREIIERGIKENKKCWHPEASQISCDLDRDGNIKVSAAHSIQNNGILREISEDGHVKSFSLKKGENVGDTKGRFLASIFFGFCNTHDAIFYPIETEKYIGTNEQKFLFAYRGFVVSSHKKIEGSYLMNFGEQYLNDIKENKKIFDNAILKKQFDILETIVIELPAFYPIASSSSFYLDFDFEGNPIPHSEGRMEKIFISLFPSNKKSYFLLSYFKADKHLYGNLERQLKARNNFKSDISMLIGGHVENIYFNPIYFDTFIKSQENEFDKVRFETQNDFVPFDTDLNISMTPNDYLQNNYEISLFGY